MRKFMSIFWRLKDLTVKLFINILSEISTSDGGRKDANWGNWRVRCEKSRGCLMKDTCIRRLASSCSWISLILIRSTSWLSLNTASRSSSCTSPSIGGTLSCWSTSSCIEVILALSTAWLGTCWTGRRRTWLVIWQIKSWWV